MTHLATLRKNLRKGEAKVPYTKEDGTKRLVRCTLEEGVIPETKHKKEASDHFVTVWDLEQKAWRTMRTDRIDWKKVQYWEHE